MIGFLDWPAAQAVSLANARQGNLDEWVASDNATLRRETRHYLRWAKKQKLLAGLNAEPARRGSDWVERYRALVLNALLAAGRAACR